MRKLFVGALMLCSSVIYAQNGTADRTAYLKTITERAAKIANGVVANDLSKQEKLTAIIRDQYDHLNDVYQKRDVAVKQAKEMIADKSQRDTAISVANRESAQAVGKLHKAYLKQLSKTLTRNEVDAVKDGMTYGVAPKTYAAYQEELLDLTEVQKQQIWTWLVEAREHAMDAESSDKKHAWFGKYKGRINNYLSAQGYDLKKAGEEWAKRRNASAQANK